MKMEMNKNFFFDELTHCADQYDEDNAWFGFKRGGPAWSQGTWTEFTVAAYKIYLSIRNNPLNMVLLGDTKLRSDPSLVFDFGFAANSDSPQEEEDKALVETLMERRRAVHGGGKWAESERPRDIMRDGGSILSARRWSPMLNDTFMLGGISCNHDFHFALTGEEIDPTGDPQPEPDPNNELEQWKKIHDPATRKIRAAALPWQKRRYAGFGKDKKVGVSPKKAKAMWLDFFQKVDHVLWDKEKGLPRVFARELIGLQVFGYKPVFTEHELGFAYAGGGKLPIFRHYLAALHDARFHAPERERIMRHLGEFLFNDRQALRDVAR